MEGTCQIQPVAALLEVQQDGLQALRALLARRAEVLDRTLQVLARLGAYAGHMVGAQGVLQQLQHLRPG